MASTALLLAACGGDTVKIFDLSVEVGDPCVFQYSPSGLQLNAARWTHTNMVVASAGEDKKISLWNKSTQALSVVPQPSRDAGDMAEECIVAINFSTKSSRYLCSGGTGKTVRIWDMQRKRCIKWLKGHTDTITGVMCNCKDEHLASISTKGDLILHNLASGSRVAEHKDPHHQVLRVLEYSRLSRHLLVVAGDDGTVHFWDTTNRSPKANLMDKATLSTKYRSLFFTGNDKILVSVGLDKKMYMYDTGVKRPVHCIPCEAPYSSLAFRDNENTLAAGTNNGRVIFYDVRGKPQPFTVLRAYSPAKAVISLSWQRSNPIPVNEVNCTADMALLGSSGEDSVVMPDPLPASVQGTRGRAGSMSSRSSTRSIVDDSAATSRTLTELATPNHLTSGANISRLQVSRSSFNCKDDMEVFSPLVDVQPITPSVSKFWEGITDSKRDRLGDGLRKISALQTPASPQRSLSAEDGNLERRLSSLQDDLPIKPLSTPCSFLNGDRSPSVTPPEVWGGDRPDDRVSMRAQVSHTISRFAAGASPVMTLPASNDSNLEDAGFNPQALARSQLGSPHKSPKEPDSILPQRIASSQSLAAVQGDTFLSEATSLSSKRMVDYINQSSPRKMQGTDKRDDMGIFGTEYDDTLENVYSGRLDGPNATTSGQLLLTTPRGSSPAQPHPPSFALQLVQRALEESLGTVQKSIHEDVQNLHLELLRQFHIQQMEMEKLMENLLAKQAELMDEIQSLRKENQQLRHPYLRGE